MGRENKDEITKYIKKAINDSGSYLLEDVLYSLQEIVPEEIYNTMRTGEIVEKLNTLKTKQEKKKKKKLLDYVA
jgi:hypothetical protein